MKRLSLLVAGAAGLAACSDAPVAPHSQEPASVTSQQKADAAPKAPAKMGPDADTPSVTTTELGGGVYMLTGQGGNVGVAVGPDSVLVIDDQFERMSAAILSAISDTTDKPISAVINTHYHGDHTGGNAKLAAAGATILAHDNVHKRMSETQRSALFERDTPPADISKRPHMTYSAQTTFHTTGQKARIIHTPSGHTDGDSIVYFSDANVIHMGDNFFNGLFPYIDTAAGGSLKGMIAAHQTALDLANADTQIIPGHGPLASKADLLGAQILLKNIRAKVQARIDAGDNLEAAIAADPLAGLEAYESFITKDTMVKAAYMSLNP